MCAASVELASRRHRMMVGAGAAMELVVLDAAKELAADAAMETIPYAANEPASSHGNSPRCHRGRDCGGSHHRRQELGGPRE
jgi:hypothetical protein